MTSNFRMISIALIAVLAVALSAIPLADGGARSDASGAHTITFGISEDGSYGYVGTDGHALFMMGQGTYGNLGAGDLGAANRPFQISAQYGGLEDYEMSSRNTYFIADGRLYAMGENAYGQLGLGDRNKRTVPEQVAVDSDGRAIGKVIDVSCSEYTAHFVTEDGKLYAMGSSSFGPLGDGSHNLIRDRPVMISLDEMGASMPPIAAVYEGAGNNAVAVSTDGRAYAMSTNNWGTLCVTGTHYRPVQISADSVGNPIGTVAKVAQGNNTSYLLTSGGELYSCGSNDCGQIGDGSTSGRFSAYRIDKDADGNGIGTIVDVSVKALEGGKSVLILNDRGEVFAFGNNSSGQLGVGDTSNRLLPTLIATDSAGNELPEITAISAGSSKCYLLSSSGTVYGMGLNTTSSPLGVGNTAAQNRPCALTLDASGNPLPAFASIHAGDAYVFMITADGALYAAGDGDFSKLGTGSSSDLGRPKAVTTDYNGDALGKCVGVKGIRCTAAAVFEHGSVAVGSIDVPDGESIAVSGDTLLIGEEGYRAVPRDNAQYSHSFVQWDCGNGTVNRDMMVTATFARSVNQYDISVGVSPVGYGTFAYGHDGSYAEGHTSMTITVDYGTPISRDGPVLTVGDHTFTAVPKIDGAQYDYSLIAWADSNYDLTHDAVTGPLTITAKFERMPTEYTVVIDIDGNGTLQDLNSVRTWGYSTNGIGLGSSTVQRIPMTLSLDADGNPIGKVASIVNTGSSLFLITEDGRAYACGQNSYGVLGLGDTARRYSPVQIPTGFLDAPGDRIAMIACDNSQTLIVTEEGAVYGVGSNPKGQLGLGDTSSRLTPARISADADGNPIGTVVYAVLGQNCAFLVTEDGRLYAAGDNQYGKLGLGDTVQRNMFHLVAGVGTVVKVLSNNSNTLVLNSDGEAYAFGQNLRGMFGLGDTSQHSSPVRIGSSLGRIADIGLDQGNVYLLTEGGRLYGAGYNGVCQLGDGTVRDSTAMVIISQDVAEFKAFTFRVLYLKTDGNLYGTGSNYSGALGNGIADDAQPHAMQVNIDAYGNSIGPVEAFGGSTSDTYFYTADGLFSVGKNNNGQLGTGSRDAMSGYPVQIISDRDGNQMEVVSIHAASDAVAVIVQTGAADSRSVRYGDAIAVSGDLLTIGGAVYRAVPSPGCTFEGFTIGSDSVSGDMTVTVEFDGDVALVIEPLAPQYSVSGTQYGFRIGVQGDASFSIKSCSRGTASVDAQGNVSYNPPEVDGRTAATIIVTVSSGAYSEDVTATITIEQKLRFINGPSSGVIL